jgi:hypothetical protein
VRRLTLACEKRSCPTSRGRLDGFNFPQDGTGRSRSCGHFGRATQRHPQNSPNRRPVLIHGALLSGCFGPSLRAGEIALHRSTYRCNVARCPEWNTGCPRRSAPVSLGTCLSRSAPLSTIKKCICFHPKPGRHRNFPRRHLAIPYFSRSPSGRGVAGRPGANHLALCLSAGINESGYALAKSPGCSYPHELIFAAFISSSSIAL